MFESIPIIWRKTFKCLKSISKASRNAVYAIYKCGSWNFFYIPSTMHLTRPKSSKGRSRPALNSFHDDSADAQRPPASLDSPELLSPAKRSLRPEPQPVARQAGQRRQTPKHRPAAPLNKYKVLPSIERKRSEVSPGLDSAMSNLSLFSDAVMPQRLEEADSPAGIQMCSSWEETAGSDDGNQRPQRAKFTETGACLLLAIRAPCGRRFQQFFDPTDTLLTVKARAEVKYGAQYGNVCIQTMDMPRRTFTDMDMTLDQCGILSRTLLCICQNDV